MLLNNFVKTSEQFSILAFNTFGVIFLNALAFFRVAFPISDTGASVKTRDLEGILLNLNMSEYA